MTTKLFSLQLSFHAVFTAALLLASVTASTSGHAQNSPTGSSGTEALQEAPASNAPVPSAVVIASGKQTRTWLNQQGGRQQASRTRQTMSGPVMTKVYERYVNSFAEPVKESVRDMTPISND